MSSELDTAETVARVIEAMRAVSERYRKGGLNYVASRLMEPEIVAAAIQAHIAIEHTPDEHAAFVCDECEVAIPHTPRGSLVSRHHDPACSLHDECAP